jgi:hypothetical protein
VAQDIVKLKSTFSADGSYTFENPSPHDVLNVSLFFTGGDNTKADATASVKLEYVDEDGDLIAVDGSPFAESAATDTTASGTNPRTLVLQLLAQYPKLKATVARGADAGTVVVKAKTLYGSVSQANDGSKASPYEEGAGTAGALKG